MNRRSEMPELPGATLHHIGLVVEDIAAAGRTLEVLGLKTGKAPEPDPIQEVTASFLDLTGRGRVFLELLEPTEEGSPISGYLAKGGGLHHLCFQVADIEAAYQGLADAGYRPVSEPEECLGMDRSFDRQPVKPSRVAFLMAPFRLLIELVEEGR